MTGFIESAAPLDEIARVLKTTPAAVEAEARELDLYVGCDWAGRPALSVVDAHGIISGAARRARDATAAWRSHESALEAHSDAREAARVAAFTEAYNAGMRRGSGNSSSTQSGYDAARDALEKWDAANRPPTFNGAPTTLASRLNQRVRKAKAGVS